MVHTSYQNGFFNNKQGVELYYQYWEHPDPQASVVIIHGVGEHSGRYEEFAHYFAERSVSVYSFDLCGYGKSGGKRGHIDSFSDFTSDIYSYIDFLTPRLKNSHKVFLCGHSLGALIAIQYIKNYPDHSFSGLILSGPPFKLNISMPSWINRLGIIIASIIPALTIKERRIQLNMLTHDKEKIEAFRKDPYRHYQRSLRFVGEYFKAEKNTYNYAEKIAVPLLIVQGGEDDIIDVQKVKSFYHKVTIEDKTLIIYPEMYHEVLNEIDRDRVYTDIYAWVMRDVKIPETKLHG